MSEDGGILLTKDANQDNVNLERTDKDAEDRSLVLAQANTGTNQYMAGIRPVPYLTPVECYACTDCPVIHLNTTTKQCPYSNDYTKRNKCVVYVEKYKHTKKPWYIRGCASERSSCTEIRRAHNQLSDIVKLVSCQECEGDRCNASISCSLSDFLMAFFVLVFTPFSLNKLI
ncbi:uncharacterized protein LOC131851314 [Achroia grisella]|uniref:uncharacterized protein LOC131851314 n=1 Tax=Achroia grisella TaxID=688607 RepID=UPI0027D32823|nr:uncharacterized protein LOC131851314 [Achroia grisella]